MISLLNLKVLTTSKYYNIPKGIGVIAFGCANKPKTVHQNKSGAMGWCCVNKSKSLLTTRNQHNPKHVGVNAFGGFNNPKTTDSKKIRRSGEMPLAVLTQNKNIMAVLTNPNHYGTFQKQIGANAYGCAKQYLQTRSG